MRARRRAIVNSLIIDCALSEADLIQSESAFIAAAVVGIIHMSAPDHWATLAVLGRGANWTRRKLIGVSLVSSSGHVSFSVFLGLAMVEVTSFFSKFISHYFTEAIGLIMVITGLYVALRALRGKEENHSNVREGWSRSLTRTAGYYAILGAALSPDLSILPILLVAAPLGLSVMLHTVVIFAISSILTAVLLVIVFSTIITKAVEKIPSKYNDALVGLVIAAVGVYVLILG
jgi:putative Mn2+ efflux pump MntP